LGNEAPKCESDTADPLYKERSEVVSGKREVPVEYAERSKDKEDGEPDQAAAKGEPDEDQGPAAPGIPEFWLGAMRAHPLISEHVRYLPSIPASQAASSRHFRAESTKTFSAASEKVRGLATRLPDLA